MKIPNIPYIYALALAIVFTSCVTTKYESPQITDNKLYRDMMMQDSTTIADIPWKEYFRDANLQNLINEGLQNNIDLQIASARIKQTEAGLNSAKLGYLPTLVGDASYTSSKLNTVQGGGLKKTL